MNLHLVGGFLGSGKTTAIIAAAKALMASGKKVGVVTNDQGKYLVDTAFFRLSDIPAVEVTGGCFCCNYDDLEARLDQLRGQMEPDVVFAESVGSCGDLVATVIKPLLALRGSEIPPTSFSVFVDSRLLQMRLSGEDLPFSENVVYIFDKQIEEASLLIINKVDLLSADEAVELERLARQHFPEKAIRLQDSQTPESVAGWVELIEAGGLSLSAQPLEMDYQRYGDGEARLAWLDEEITFQASNGAGREFVIETISAILNTLQAEKAAIGHLKFLVRTGGTDVKISFPTLQEVGWQEKVPAVIGTSGGLLVNARVEIGSERLHDLVKKIVADAAGQVGVKVQEVSVESFHPNYPNPTHRMNSPARE